MTVAVAPSSSPPALRARRIVRWYIGGAIFLFNTILLFVVINLICWVVLAVHNARTRPAYLSHSDASYRAIYAPMPDADWKELLRETKERPYGFQAYTMFTETEYHGRFLNVSQQGFRIGPDQGPWPMDPKNFNVWTFGNSTMFGFAVPDDQTVAAYLQGLLQAGQMQRVCVYNFGRRAYFSTQERILFEQLLHDGARPDLAVFVDGPADFLFGVDPTFERERQDELLTPQGDGERLLGLWQSLPAAQLGHLLAQKYLPAPKAAPRPDPEAVDPLAISHYVWNKSAIEAISKPLGVQTLFVYQPTPVYMNDAIFKQHEWEADGDDRVIKGYPLMASYVKSHDMGKDFLWLAELRGDHPETSYIDKWHYSPAFSKQIAGVMTDFLRKASGVAGAN